MTSFDRDSAPLQQALGNWQIWQTQEGTVFSSQPQVVRVLQGGKTNCTYLVESEGLQAAVRINPPNDEQLGIDRKREKLILQQLEPTGLIPKVFYCDRHSLVSEYIAGTLLTERAVQQQTIREALDNAIKTIQCVTVPGISVLNYHTYLEHYCQQIPQQFLSDSIRADISSLAKTIDSADWQPVLCHHDLVLENIIINNKGLYIIDWEYAALGHPQLDFLRIFGGDYANTVYSGVEQSLLLTMQNLIDQLWFVLQYPQLMQALEKKLSIVLGDSL